MASTFAQTIPFAMVAVAVTIGDGRGETESRGGWPFTHSVHFGVDYGQTMEIWSMDRCHVGARMRMSDERNVQFNV